MTDEAASEETRPDQGRRRMLGAILAGFASAGVSGRAGRAAEGRALDLGAITVTDGTRVRALEDVLPAEPTLLHLWATWCAPCLTELPQIASFAAELDRRGAAGRLLLVSVDRKPFAQVRSFLDDDLALPDLRTWQVADGPIGSAFRVFGYPASFIIGPGPSLLWRHEGSLSWTEPGVVAALAERLRLNR
ncbi:TlpA disulfide reductase family protein [Fulvimarina sp. 2208YS6-2-32]|uniref:TlpA disulfide reductase family protein n=1 Tax=Fulvimarina uroteuthidis TaxID=3098149 RepID=A0ABU5I161_9HYPH|nr:TlpA disulfide reductase family protein [Fulvimarina sp. 2208YS6-2-32]MDY8109070.1 TlpA disulfide reductase family protein [Fulvimarina sp. 2208YS6-2-32]